MRLHRFMGNFDLSVDTLRVTDSELLSQWKNVLRLESGDMVILTDGRGMEAEATLDSIDKKAASLSISSRTKMHPEPKRAITLYASLLRRENFELIVQKATEIGAARVVPLITARTVKTGYNAARLEKILTEACEQSGRTHRPELSEPMAFESAIAECEPKETILFHVSQTISKADFTGAKISLFIGPEGGFTNEEVLLAKNRGIPVRTLGTLTLRAETAAIAATFIATL